MGKTPKMPKNFNKQLTDFVGRESKDTQREKDGVHGVSRPLTKGQFSHPAFVVILDFHLRPLFFRCCCTLKLWLVVGARNVFTT